MANKKSVSIKLKSSGPNSGPFDIFDLSGNKLASNLTIQDLI